jgi:hypothetical protein
MVGPALQKDLRENEQYEFSKRQMENFKKKEHYCQLHRMDNLQAFVVHFRDNGDFKAEGF